MKRIMIVDDDPAIREVLSFNLSSRGYDVSHFSNGADAIESAMQVHPDIILLDVIMPDIDGWEVCKIIKDHFDDESVKVVILTARNTDRDRMIGKAILKADEYLTKPFDLDELYALLKRLSGEI